MQMNTTNTLMAAPMVRVHPRASTPMARLARPSIDELLDQARTDPDHQEWFWLFDSKSLLHVAGGADLMVVVELIATAPNERLAGYVEGLYVNN